MTNGSPEFVAVLSNNNNKRYSRHFNNDIFWLQRPCKVCQTQTSKATIANKMCRINIQKFVYTYFDADVNGRVSDVLKQLVAERAHPREQTTWVGTDAAAYQCSVADCHWILFVWTADHWSILISDTHTHTHTHTHTCSLLFCSLQAVPEYFVHSLENLIIH